MPTLCPKCQQMVPLQPECPACGEPLMRQTRDGGYEPIEQPPSIWHLAVEPLGLLLGILLVGLLFIVLLVWLLL